MIECKVIFIPCDRSKETTESIENKIRAKLNELKK